MSIEPPEQLPMSKPKCETCRNYKPDAEGRVQGECHYYPPRTKRLMWIITWADWPPVAADDWCDFHRPKE